MFSTFNEGVLTLGSGVETLGPPGIDGDGCDGFGLDESLPPHAARENINPATRSFKYFSYYPS